MGVSLSKILSLGLMVYSNLLCAHPTYVFKRILDAQQIERDRASNFNLSDIRHNESDLGEINANGNQ